ncbi:MAG: DUF1398 domain-containing protein [Anaerolineaceae bacterium]|nr:DUF1398 domain-containing protein [Anaerolineaceae bacterium]
MFTIEQINDIHHRLGSATTLADYLHALAAIGIQKYDSYLTDGHSEYFGAQGQTVTSPSVHEKLSIAEKSDKDAFLNHLKQHEQGKTDYFEMSRGLADSGIEKWTFDTHKMTITYYDKSGVELLTETIS